MDMGSKKKAPKKAAPKKKSTTTKNVVDKRCSKCRKKGHNVRTCPE
jgi:hypothetical protein